MDPDEQQQRQPPDEPTLPSAEQMRARRLAKLGGSVAPSSSSSAETKPAGSEKSATESSGANTPAVSSSVTAVASPVPSRNSTPSSVPRPSPAQSPIPSRSQAGKAASVEASAAQTMTQDSGMRPPKIQKPESFEDWADRTISHFFRVTLDPDHRADALGHPLTYLPNLASELEESLGRPKDGDRLRLSQDSLDAIILEAATLFPHQKPLLDYLLPCWKRIIRFSKSAAMVRSPAPEKLALVSEAKRLCMSNALFALTVPDLFGREANPKHDSLAPYLLRGLDNESGVCLDFLEEAVKRLDEDESFTDVFVNAMVEISTRLSKMSLADNFRPHVDVLKLYSKHKELMVALARHDAFLLPTTTTPPLIEKDTILGPFFRLSPLQQIVSKSYFPNPTSLDENAIRSAQDAMRITLSAHQMDLAGITNSFVRANEETRNRMLDWLALVVNSNHKRRAMQVDPKEVSSDGFMINVTYVVNDLCQPFMDPSFTKVGRIDTDYLRRNPRVSIKDETKLNADQQQSDDFYSKKADGTTNFISEVFFLGLAAHNYGNQSIAERLKAMDRTNDSFRRNLEAFEAERHRLLNNPTRLQIFDARTAQYREALDLSLANKHAVVGVLTDEKMQTRSLQFMRYVTVWLLRVASQTPYTPDTSLKIPLASPPADVFGCLPEYALQIVLDNFKFVYNAMPQILMSSVGDELMVLCITLLESSDYIRNPYMKAKLVTLLYFGVTQFYRHWKNGVMSDMLTNSKFANEHLLHALMKFYIECESTGANSAFYDKFNIRFEISYIIQRVWPNTHYHQQLTQQSKTNRAFFIRFVNMLLNDATYVLDEALGKFHKIHELQMELREAGSLTEEEKRQKQDELHTVEGHATSYMHLTNQTVAMMKLFTEALGDAFTMPEIVQRLAGMLDYNLETLVGPKSSKLKVENPQKYRFEPKMLLAEITDIYLNLGKKPAFIEAVAADGRSYKPETFDAAARIMQSRALADHAKVTAWARLAAKVVAAKKLAEQAEQDFGEIPAEFEDPLMSDLMKDPVRLPSGNVVDRSTITQHLLSDAKDPFTRQPMSIDDVVPCDELRAQIEAWKAGRMAVAKEKLAAIADGSAPEVSSSGGGSSFPSADSMDTS
ncbi:ubiquitin conjugation factor E4 [Magnaporthiopsis poae ATCC 64411]|uniref:Ubiquitin conjugation factor E4 n=1 Tax=Magnaporthiopsis poae (strain ATCC 64411 / 73-15) TaxID=644358 RepID=A0A0C4DLU4_MAGP6|nr:ubiquitin conjugation factor E4 [Magnaporthiopsis poae ATCC 64411]